VRLQTQQAGDGLQVVLDAMVHLLEQRALDHQFAVFDGDRDLIAQRGEDRQFVVGKNVQFFRVTVQHADHALAHPKRHAGQAGQPFALGDFGKAVFGRALHVQDGHGFAGRNRRPATLSPSGRFGFLTYSRLWVCVALRDEFVLLLVQQ
jgi:hypothetical protein